MKISHESQENVSIFFEPSRPQIESMNTATETRSLARASSISLKAAMAITGFLMAGWLTLHMLGNLLVFAGPDVMNAYAAKLRDTGLLWPMRAALLAILAIHATCA